MFISLHGELVIPPLQSKRLTTVIYLFHYNDTAVSLQ